MLKLEIDLGVEKTQLVAGIAEYYEPSQVIGQEVPVLVNLEPKTIRGIESKGMILAIEANGRPVLLNPDKEVPPGCIVR